MKFGLTIALSESCNMNCTYCFEHEKTNKHISIEDLEGLDIYFNDPEFDNDVKLFGGEPTLNMKGIKYLLDKYGDRDIYWTLITNGLRIPKMEQWELDCLKKINAVCVSMEGNNLAYKTIRNIPNTLEYIKLLKSHHNDFSLNLSVNGLLFKDLKGLDEVLKYCKNNGIFIHWYTLRSFYNYWESNEDFVNFMKWMRKHYYRHYLYILHIRYVDNSAYRIMGINTNSNLKNPFSCNMDGDLNVRWDGTISPCMYHKDINYGKDVFKETGYTPGKLLEINIGILANVEDSYDKCRNCIIPNKTGCAIACSGFLRESYDNPELDRLCDLEKIRYVLQQEELKHCKGKIKRHLLKMKEY